MAFIACLSEPVQLQYIHVFVCLQLSALAREVHSYLMALVGRRQQVVEFTSKFTEYLSQGDIASSCAFNTVQLILVSLQYH